MNNKLVTRFLRIPSVMLFALVLFLLSTHAAWGQTPQPNVSAEMLPNGNVLNPEALMKACAPHVAKENIDRVTHVESKWNAFAININYQKRYLDRQPSSKEEAISTAQRLLKANAGLKDYSLDLGVAMINTKNLIRYNVDLATVFDPCTNLQWADFFLVDCYQRASKLLAGEEAIKAAFSCYNTGNFKTGLENGYVAKIYRAVPKRHVRVVAYEH